MRGLPQAQLENLSLRSERYKWTRTIAECWCRASKTLVCEEFVMVRGRRITVGQANPQIGLTRNYELQQLVIETKRPVGMWVSGRQTLFFLRL
jgi:hypothetical protein